MEPQAILSSVAILAGVGTTFGALIALTNAKMRVEEDPRLDELTDLLPGANCGACGFAGCRSGDQGGHPSGDLHRHVRRRA